jgi:hypothetical protein
VDKAASKLAALADWIQHWNAGQFLYDWQTLIAGVLALLAAWLTIRATKSSADREIAASQAQTAVVQKQIETTLRLERRRVANEGYAFHATIWAAMERVLLEESEAKSIFLKLKPSDRSTKQAYVARRHFSKGLFPELRSACARYGGRITRDLLEVESAIDKYASQTEEGEQFASGRFAQLGLHADFLQQLELIQAKATYLRKEAVAEMERAKAVIAETEAEPPTKSAWRRLAG